MLLLGVTGLGVLPDFGGGAGGSAMQQQMMSMMEQPHIRGAVQSLMAQPGMMEQMIQANPQASATARLHFLPDSSAPRRCVCVCVCGSRRHESQAIISYESRGRLLSSDAFTARTIASACANMAQCALSYPAGNLVRISTHARMDVGPFHSRFGMRAL
jgi:hypothetical protein